MDVEERDNRLKSVIKSNLISCGLLPYQIEEITDQILDDVVAVLDNYEMSKL